MNKHKISIALVDDQHLFRQGMASLLTEYDDMDVIMEASNGQEFLQLLKTKQPHIVLLDLEMQVMDGIETTIALKSNYPDVKIIILSFHSEDEFIIHLIEKGANGFLPKNTDIEVVVDAIRMVLANGYYFDDYISKAMIKGLVQTKKIKPRFNAPDLSERELEVVTLICKEFTNKEIGEKLFLSHRTIDSYRESILLKTGARNTAGIVMYAVKNNLLD